VGWITDDLIARHLAGKRREMFFTQGRCKCGRVLVDLVGLSSGVRRKESTSCCHFGKRVQPNANASSDSSACLNHHATSHSRDISKRRITHTQRTRSAMLLKRKRSANILSSPTSEPPSNPNTVQSFYPHTKPVLSPSSPSVKSSSFDPDTPSYLDIRTRKRYRDNRPDPDSIHGSSQFYRIGAMIPH
jgi:hypothetical protein